MILLKTFAMALIISGALSIMIRTVNERLKPKFKPSLLIFLMIIKFGNITRKTLKKANDIYIRTKIEFLYLFASILRFLIQKFGRTAAMLIIYERQLI